MADNLQVTEGSGITVASDDVGGVQYQRVKVERGQDGKATSDPKYASISASSSGDNAIVAAVTSKKIRVLSYVLTASAAVNAKWRSATTDKSGLLYLDAKGGVAAAENHGGLLETASGEALNLNLSSAVAVGGHVSYVEEAA